MTKHCRHRYYHTWCENFLNSFCYFCRTLSCNRKWCPECYPCGMLSHSKTTLYVHHTLSRTFWGNDMLVSGYAIKWSRHCPLSSPLWFVFCWQSADRAQRRLVKNSFIVELSDGHRKLRHLFLFNDVIACAKYKVKYIVFRMQKSW